MLKRSAIPTVLLILTLLLSLILSACGDSASSSPFKGFKEVELGSSMKAAIAYYNAVTRTPSEEAAKVLQSLEEKYYTSDESDLEKLANEIDTTLTGLGYTFDTTGSSSLKNSGAKKPIHMENYWVAAYSKSQAPDIIFVLSPGSKWYGGKNLSWLEVAGANPEDLKKFKETLDKAKSVLYTRSTYGLLKSSESSATPTPVATSTPK